MSKAKKSKYLTKKTSFQGKELMLYSIDGNIWSSRPWELEKIVERHEMERIKLDPTAAVAEVEGKGDAPLVEKEVEGIDLPGVDLPVVDLPLDDLPIKAGKGKAAGKGAIAKPAGKPTKKGAKKAPARK